MAKQQSGRNDLESGREYEVQVPTLIPTPGRDPRRNADDMRYVRFIFMLLVVCGHGYVDIVMYPCEAMILWVVVTGW